MPGATSPAREAAVERSETEGGFSFKRIIILKELATTETKIAFRYKRFTHVCASLCSFKRGSLLMTTDYWPLNSNAYPN